MTEKFEQPELWDMIKNDLEAKGATVNTLEAEVTAGGVKFTIIVTWPDGQTWNIVRIDQE